MKTKKTPAASNIYADRSPFLTGRSTARRSIRPTVKQKSKPKFKTNWRTWSFIATVLLVAAIGTYFFGFSRAGTPPRKVIGYLVYWDKFSGMQSIQSNADIITSVSPWAYTLKANGDVTLDPNGGASIVDSPTLSYLREKNIQIIPSIHNFSGAGWNGNNLTSKVIKSPPLTDRHINAIVSLVESKGYDGIDIDYENLSADDRQAYTAFMAKLSAALHARGKVLTAAVYGKTSEPGSWAGEQAQDYRALGALVDELRIKLYDYNPVSRSDQAPAAWTDEVLKFAGSVVPANKIIHGMPLYGYDWKDAAPPQDVTYSQAMNLLARHNPPLQRDSASQSPSFTYSDGKSTHIVRYEDAASISRKLDTAAKHKVAGLHFWHVGNEDPAVWTEVRSKFTGTGLHR